LLRTEVALDLIDGVTKAAQVPADEQITLRSIRACPV
jgi:hypothetical protein